MGGKKLQEAEKPNRSFSAFTPPIYFHKCEKQTSAQRASFFFLSRKISAMLSILKNSIEPRTTPS
jgi:hypothetical protein